MIQTKTCARIGCDNTFTPKSNRQKYCCKECADESEREQARLKYIKKRSRDFREEKKNSYTLAKTSRECRLKGMTYAEHQIAKTLSLVPKIKLDISS